MADLDRLIAEEVEEGQGIDFKQDVPWGDSPKKVGSPWDPASGRLDRNASNEVLAVLVSFANAEGGVLVLGMKETADLPPRAAGITPITAAEELAKRLRSCIAWSIDPRLPFADVRVIKSGAEGCGVILLEASVSSNAPHWVATNRKPVVRRRDESTLMTMAEVHRAVLARAGRNDAVEAELDKAAADFETRFFDTVNGFCNVTVAGVDLPTRVRAWFKHANVGVAGVRATIVPFEAFGFSSLEAFPTDDLPSAFAVSGTAPDFRRITYPVGQSVPFAGGVESRLHGSDYARFWRARRDGLVEVAHVSVKPSRRLILNVADVVDCVASALGIFGSLAARAFGHSDRGRVAVEILTLGRLTPCVATADGLNEQTGLPLLGKVPLERRDVGGGEPLDAVIDPIAADFVNAGGMTRDVLPRYRLRAPRA